MIDLQQARADAISHRQTPVPTRFEASSQQGLVEPCSPGHASHSHAIGQLYLTGQRPALAARAPSETRLDNSRPPSLSRPMLGPIINGMVDPSITTPCPRSAPTLPGLLASDKSPKSRVPGLLVRGSLIRSDSAWMRHRPKPSTTSWAVTVDPFRPASRTPLRFQDPMCDTPDAPPEVARVGLTARAACTPFGWV